MKQDQCQKTYLHQAQVALQVEEVVEQEEQLRQPLKHQQHLKKQQQLVDILADMDYKMNIIKEIR
jgi:hypothetical protein